MVVIQHHTGLRVSYDTVYVLYSFLTITVEGTVCAVTVTVTEVGTHSIPVINPNCSPVPTFNISSLLPSQHFKNCLYQWQLVIYY